MQEITTKELSEKLTRNEDLNIVDVREDEEVAQGKIPGAKHIPLGDLSDCLDELPKNEHYYMICRSGGRSHKASEFLEAKGYRITNVDGGMLAWNGEVET